MWDWIVQILFQALQLIQGFAGDWGLSIIILVVIIRLALTPMMLKSTKSTARMQVLQPKLMEIQERYADDPQRQAEEMQKFYSENKFNPFGGCLPLLIQMPILIALFNLLRDLGHYFPSAAEQGFSFFNILPNLVMSPSQAFAGGFAEALPYLLALDPVRSADVHPAAVHDAQPDGRPGAEHQDDDGRHDRYDALHGLGHSRRRPVVL